ncbi:MAG: ABC transporter substrate-binding protein [Polyangiaceae bacterium]|nr:ABC transporter substrate-binding protein [Polyangiaceae bacterium]
MIRRRTLIALLTLSAVYAGCKKDGAAGGPAGATSGSAGPGAGSGEVVVGHYASMTGSEAHFGQDTDKAIRMAIDEVNGSGGVVGRKLKVVTVDTRGDAAEAANAVTRLIDVERSVAILGEVASSLSLPGGRIAQRRKIPMVSPSSTNPKVTEIGDYVFRVCFIDPFQGKVMAKFAKENLKIERVAVLKDQKSDYSIGLADAFKAAFEPTGGKIVVEQSYSKGDTDFSAQLTAIKNTDAQAIFVPGYYTDVGAIAKTAERLGVKLILLGGDGWDSPDLFKIGGNAINGAYFSNHFAPDAATPKAKKFVADFKAKHGVEPTGLGALGWDAAMVLVEAMKKAGGFEADAVRKALSETRDFEGVTGKITMDPQRNANKSAVVLKVVDGAAKYETTVEP